MISPLKTVSMIKFQSCCFDCKKTTSSRLCKDLQKNPHRWKQDKDMLPRINREKSALKMTQWLWLSWQMVTSDTKVRISNPVISKIYHQHIFFKWAIPNLFLSFHRRLDSRVVSHSTLSIGMLLSDCRWCQIVYIKFVNKHIYWCFLKQLLLPF